MFVSLLFLRSSFSLVCVYVCDFSHCSHLESVFLFEDLLNPHVFLFFIVFFFLFMSLSTSSPTQLYFSVSLGYVLKSAYGIHKYCSTLSEQKRGLATS